MTEKKNKKSLNYYFVGDYQDTFKGLNDILFCCSFVKRCTFASEDASVAVTRLRFNVRNGVPLDILPFIKDELYCCLIVNIFKCV